MSLREMHEQQKSEQASPRERIQELNRQSRTELENSLLKEALALSSESCEELMKQSNQGQARAEQNRQRDAELSRQLISELKKQVEQLENSNELLQNAISAGIGSLIVVIIFNIALRHLTHITQHMGVISGMVWPGSFMKLCSMSHWRTNSFS